ncbi:complex I subunit 5 family protein [Sulfurospirillum sp. 1612]|uniref:complex I subunit 5 family protein n=1 Tax=Sulfurospirillum sp. 1612 TaxID=3094835 RepID=UPI002F92ACFC
MSLGYYFLLPVIFSFLVPFFKKFGSFSLRSSAIVLHVILFVQTLFYMKTTLPQISQFSVAPPIGIAFILDNFSLLFLLIFTFSGVIVSLYMFSYFKTHESKNETRFYVFFNMLIAGSIGLILSCDIFNVYIFFEITGISSYALAAYNKDKKGLEGGIKYLIIGSIASVFIVFAIMLIYLQIGTVNIGLIAQRYTEINPQIAMLIALMLFIGFGTKAELFPMNFWAPDIYQGSSSHVNALFSSVVAKAYMFVFFHLFYLLGLNSKYTIFVMAIGAVTFFISEFTALNQKDIKRLLAYSTLGQIGILFFALASHSSETISGALFQLTSHSLSKLMIFLALGIIISKLKNSKITIVGDFKSSFLALILIIGFLSILGIPPFSGFVGKILILKGFALAHNYIAIAFILLVSLVEAVYFFRLIALMLDKKRTKTTVPIGFLNYAILSFCAFLIILFGIAPSLLIHYTDLATHALLHAGSYLHYALGVGL